MFLRRSAAIRTPLARTFESHSMFFDNLVLRISSPCFPLDGARTLVPFRPP